MNKPLKYILLGVGVAAIGLGVFSFAKTGSFNFVQPIKEAGEVNRTTYESTFIYSFENDPEALQHTLKLGGETCWYPLWNFHVDGDEDRLEIVPERVEALNLKPETFYKIGFKISADFAESVGSGMYAESYSFDEVDFLYEADNLFFSNVNYYYFGLSQTACSFKISDDNGDSAFELAYSLYNMFVEDLTELELYPWDYFYVKSDDIDNVSDFLAKMANAFELSIYFPGESHTVDLFLNETEDFSRKFCCSYPWFDNYTLINLNHWWEFRYQQITTDVALHENVEEHWFTTDGIGYLSFGIKADNYLSRFNDQFFDLDKELGFIGYDLYHASLEYEDVFGIDYLTPNDSTDNFIKFYFYEMKFLDDITCDYSNYWDDLSAWTLLSSLYEFVDDFNYWFKPINYVATEVRS